MFPFSQHRAKGPCTVKFCPSSSSSQRLGIREIKVVEKDPLGIATKHIEIVLDKVSMYWWLKAIVFYRTSIASAAIAAFPGVAIAIARYSTAAAQKWHFQMGFIDCTRQNAVVIMTVAHAGH